MKRLTLTIALLLAGAVLVFAAGSGEEAATDDDGTRTIVAFFNDAYNNQATFRGVVDAFDAANPDIELDISDVTDPDESYKKVAVRMASGQPVDLIRMNNPIVLQQHVNAGALMPLDDLAEQYDFDPEAYYGSGAAMTRVDDEFYMVGFTKTQWALFYNKMLFDQAGIEYPSSTEPMTWEEYRALAEELTTGEGTEKTYGALHLQWPMYWYGSAIQRLGGGEAFYDDEGMSNIEHPAFRESIERYYLMQGEDNSVPSYADIISQKVKANAYMNGRYAMYVHGSWMLSWMKNQEEFPRDWQMGIAPMPVYEGAENPYSWGVIDGMSIGTTSEEPEAAFELAKYMVDNAVDHTDGGVFLANIDTDMSKLMPLMVSGLEDDGITEDVMESVYFDPSIQMVTEKVTGPSAVEYERIAVEETEKYFVDAQSLDETIANIKRRADALLSD